MENERFTFECLRFRDLRSRPKVKKFMNCVMLDMILSPMKVIIIYVFKQANSGAPELLIVTGKAKN